MTCANAYSPPCSDCDPAPPGRMAAGALASVGLVVALYVLLLGGVVRVCWGAATVEGEAASGSSK